MIHYATVIPRFWTGTTGRQIARMAKQTAAGADAQRVAFYLMTNGHANIIGLYFLPIMYLCEEVGIEHDSARSALQILSTLEYSFYDDTTETVWVKEMACHQLGNHLTKTDGRVKAVARIYKSMQDNPFLGRFYDRYHSALHLPTRREPQPRANGGASWAPPEGAPEGTPTGGVTPPGQGQGQGTGQGKGTGQGPSNTVTQNSNLRGRVDILREQSETRARESNNEAQDTSHATPEWIAQRWNQIDGVVKLDEDPSGPLKKRIESQIRERKTKAWWEKYFVEVAKSDWLCGRNEKGWAASLFWAMGPVNIAKVLGGQFPNRGPAKAASPSPTEQAAKGCNANPTNPCGLPVVSRVGDQRRCPWHSYLDKHPEQNEDEQTFSRYWPTVHAAIRKPAGIADAWRKANGDKPTSHLKAVGADA